MAYSGVTTFSMTAAEIIKNALQKCAVLEEGESPNTTQNTDGLLDLNILIKSLTKYGLTLWTIETLSLPLVQSTITYTIGEGGDLDTFKPVKILECAFKDTSGNETTMTPLTRNEYEDLPNKSITGQPTQFFFDPQIPLSEFSVWPTADATAATGTVEMQVQLYIQDVSATTDDMYFPAEWYDCVIYQLAIRMAPTYGVPLQERVKLEQMAQKLLDETLAWDNEQESIFLRPTPIWQK